MADFSVLNQEIKGKIVTSSDKAYEYETKQSWNAVYRSRRPLAFVKVRGKEDVEKTVKFCLNNKLEMCVSNGGITEFCMKDDAVVIDLSGMRQVQVDGSTKTAIVEGGAKVADVDEALYEHGFVIPLGSYSQLGVAGMTLIGGQGFTSRCFGLSSDNVLEYDLVLATGESIKVSAEEHPELYWGMKGYGSNFGIVTSMKFQVHEIPKLVVGGSMFFQFSNAKDAAKKCRDYAVGVNDNCLSLYMMIHITPTGPELVVRLYYCGTLRRGGEIVQDIVDLTRPYRFSCGPVEHPDFQRQGDYMLPGGRYNYGVEGHFLSELKDEVIDSLFNCVQDVGTNHFLSGSIVYMSENFGGKDSEVSYEQSSFPFRKNARYWIGVHASTKKEENFDAVKQWAENFQNTNTEYSIPLHNGGNKEEIMEKLKGLKNQYDPNDVFHNNLIPIDA